MVPARPSPLDPISDRIQPPPMPPPDPAQGLSQQAEIRDGLVPVQVHRLDQAQDRSRPLAGMQQAGEEPVLCHP